MRARAVTKNVTAGLKCGSPGRLHQGKNKKMDWHGVWQNLLTNGLPGLSKVNVALVVVLTLLAGWLVIRGKRNR